MATMAVNGGETATTMKEIATIAGIVIVTTTVMAVIVTITTAIGMTVIATGVATATIAGTADMIVGTVAATMVTPGTVVGVTAHRLQPIMDSRVMSPAIALGAAAIACR